MGIEAVKSSTPAPCRTMIKDALKLMMNGTEDDVIDFIDTSRKQFKKLPPEDIAFPRSASDVEKYKAHATIYAKGTPIHIRGALLFNHYVKKHNLDNKYSLIQNGEKVKFCYLKNLMLFTRISFLLFKIFHMRLVLTDTLIMIYNLTKPFWNHSKQSLMRLDGKWKKL